MLFVNESLIYLLGLFSLKNNLDNSKLFLLFSFFVILNNLFIILLNFTVFSLSTLASLKEYETQILVGDIILVYLNLE